MIKKYGKIVDDLDRTIGEQQWYGKALTNLDFCDARIDDMIKVMKNDETLKSMLGWRNYMSATYESQKDLMNTFKEINILAFRNLMSEDPVSAGSANIQPTK